MSDKWVVQNLENTLDTWNETLVKMIAVMGATDYLEQFTKSIYFDCKELFENNSFGIHVRRLIG